MVNLADPQPVAGTRTLAVLGIGGLLVGLATGSAGTVLTGVAGRSHRGRRHALRRGTVSRVVRAGYRGGPLRQLLLEIIGQEPEPSMGSERAP
jgi:hypothetical protein